MITSKMGFISGFDNLFKIILTFSTSLLIFISSSSYASLNAFSVIYLFISSSVGGMFKPSYFNYLCLYINVLYIFFLVLFYKLLIMRFPYVL
jgi:hypothetical protein